MHCSCFYCTALAADGQGGGSIPGEKQSKAFIPGDVADVERAPRLLLDEGEEFLSGVGRKIVCGKLHCAGYAFLIRVCPVNGVVPEDFHPVGQLENDELLSILRNGAADEGGARHPIEDKNVFKVRAGGPFHKRMAAACKALGEIHRAKKTVIDVVVRVHVPMKKMPSAGGALGQGIH